MNGININETAKKQKLSTSEEETLINFIEKLNIHPENMRNLFMSIKF